MKGLIRRQPREQLIPLLEAAARLCLDESTIRQGKAGTEGLTKIYQGRRCFLVEAEIEAHVQKLIAAARVRQARALQLVYNTDDEHEHDA